MGLHGFAALLGGNSHNGKTQPQLTERDVRSQIYGEPHTGNVSPAPKPNGASFTPKPNGASAVPHGNGNGLPRDARGRFLPRSGV